MSDKAPQFKKIDFDSRKFVANGTTYFIQPESITPNRFKYWQIESIQLSFAISFERLHASLMNIWKACTSGNDVIGALNIAATESHNLVKGLANIKTVDSDACLRFCTLFINRSDEDLTKWDDAMINQKITDWKSEPFDINDFFLLAVNQVPGLIERLSSISVNTKE